MSTNDMKNILAIMGTSNEDLLHLTNEKQKKKHSEHKNEGGL